MADSPHLHGAAKGHGEQRLPPHGHQTYLYLAADPPDPHGEGPMDIVQDPPTETSSKSSPAPAKHPRASTTRSTSAPPAEIRRRTEAQAFDVSPSLDDVNVEALRRRPSMSFAAATTSSIALSAAASSSPDGVNVGDVRRSLSIPSTVVTTSPAAASATNHQHQCARGNPSVVSHPSVLPVRILFDDVCIRARMVTSTCRLGPSSAITNLSL
jgi:hypothetical protein